MKLKALSFATLFAIAHASTAMQTPQSASHFGLSVLPGYQFNASSRFGNGAFLGVRPYYEINSFFNIGVLLGVFQTRDHQKHHTDVGYTALPEIQVNTPIGHSKLVPSFSLGMGLYGDHDAHFAADAGAGVSYHFSKHFSLGTQYRIIKPFNEHGNTHIVTLVASWLFGGASHQTTTKPLPKYHLHPAIHASHGTHPHTTSSHQHTPIAKPVVHHTKPTKPKKPIIHKRQHIKAAIKPATVPKVHPPVIKKPKPIVKRPTVAAVPIVHYAQPIHTAHPTTKPALKKPKHKTHAVKATPATKPKPILHPHFVHPIQTHSPKVNKPLVQDHKVTPKPHKAIKAAIHAHYAQPIHHAAAPKTSTPMHASIPSATLPAVPVAAPKTHFAQPIHAHLPTQPVVTHTSKPMAKKVKSPKTPNVHKHTVIPVLTAAAHSANPIHHATHQLHPETQHTATPPKPKQAKRAPATESPTPQTLTTSSTKPSPQAAPAHTPVTLAPKSKPTQPVTKQPAANIAGLSTVQTFIFPASINTIGQAANHVLGQFHLHLDQHNMGKRLGKRLGKAIAKPLPSKQRQLGPMDAYHALTALTGANVYVTNPEQHSMTLQYAPMPTLKKPFASVLHLTPLQQFLSTKNYDIRVAEPLTTEGLPIDPLKSQVSDYAQHHIIHFGFNHKDKIVGIAPTQKQANALAKKHRSVFYVQAGESARSALQRWASYNGLPLKWHAHHNITLVKPMVIYGKLNAQNGPIKQLIKKINAQGYQLSAALGQQALVVTETTPKPVYMRNQ